MVAACASVGDTDKASTSSRISRAASIHSQLSDEPVTLGTSFTVDGVSYTPEDIGAYDDVGYASTDGADAGPRQTANGETFNPAGVTAAHKTLPMPSYVEVTALDTGRTILVRVNARGPFANNRLIDLSEGAARQLGILGQPYAGVRVRRVNPSEPERAVLRQGMTAAERNETPESLLKILREKLVKLPAPNGTAGSPAPSAIEGGRGPSQMSLQDSRFIREGGASTTRGKAEQSNDIGTAQPYIVQIAAFSSRIRADAFARKMGAAASGTPHNGVYRVYFGPYANKAAAQHGLLRARQAGNADARITRR